ncbi:hypothetical protein OHU25_02205 [Streptomyces sp. NBC_00117]|uniref:hypothetical protein n=1 Tax=Streptomyces TaxID=1883 RepID=UPI002E2755AA
MEVLLKDYHTTYGTVQVAEMARTAASGMNTRRPRPDRVGRLDEFRLAFEKLLT